MLCCQYSIGAAHGYQFRVCTNIYDDMRILIPYILYVVYQDL